MVTQKIKKIQQYRKELATLEKQVAAQMRTELAALPADYGFSTMPEFIKALKALGRVKVKAKSKGKAVAGKKLRKKRAVITPEIKQKVKAAVAAGKTGPEIAKLFKISVPSVQNIKTELGLVKKKG
jgi:hypothetical protein